MTADVNEEHRNTILTVRLSSSERHRITEAALTANLSPSAFVRAVALSNPVTIRKYVSVAPEDLAQLKRLGNLLNQIARAGWRGRFSSATDEHLAAVLVELRIAFRKLSQPRATP